MSADAVLSDLTTVETDAFSALLSKWIEDCLEVYRIELQRLLWPVFVYSFLELVRQCYPELSRQFFEEFSPNFVRDHPEDVRNLQYVRHQEHLEENETARIYCKNKYRLSLTSSTFYTLVNFLEDKSSEGGSVILRIINGLMLINTTERAPGAAENSFAAFLARGQTLSQLPDEDEGIPGHNPGSANLAVNAPKILTRLYLGPRPLDKDLEEDVRDELQEKDEQQPPGLGEKSLIEELNAKVKPEPDEEAPDPSQVPLPKPLARDVMMEVNTVREIRDRLKLEPKSTGLSPGVSVCMFTFHNTFDSVNCMDFSGDNLYVAVGTAESYIRVWSLEGNPLPRVPGTNEADPPSTSRRLIGHSGPVYSVSFSPSVANEDNDYAENRSHYLLSSSADKTVRMWSLDSWSLLVIYKGHNVPVWDVNWGPFGFYFVSAGLDKTARMWSTDHIAAHRIFAGHDDDVTISIFHPNNAYVFTGSDDHTVRMWNVSSGTAVRIFTGHQTSITSMACAPNGKFLASADDLGNIIVWDIGNGRRRKRMRGHGPGGVWSLSWSAESSLIVSAGCDCTVRVWDALKDTEGTGAATGTKGGGEIGGKADGSTGSGVAGPGGRKGKAREVSVTSDQLSAFPTKKSPVYKVRFTNMNLIVAGSTFMPQG